MEGTVSPLPHIPPQVIPVILSEKCYGTPRSAGTARPPNTMNVLYRRLRKIIVHDNFDCWEIHSTGKERGAYQDPDFSQSKGFNDILSLTFGLTSVYRLNSQSFIGKSVRKNMSF